MVKDLVALAAEAADRHGIDRDFLFSVVHAESGWEPWSFRHEPNYKYLYYPRECAEKFGVPSVLTEEFLQKSSFGLMQVMGAVAREYGLEGWIPQLHDPAVGLEYGCRHLKKKLQKYGGDEMDAYAAYNAGSVRKTPGGMYENQAKVDRVHAKLVQLRRIA